MSFESTYLRDFGPRSSLNNAILLFDAISTTEQCLVGSEVGINELQIGVQMMERRKKEERKIGVDQAGRKGRGQGQARRGHTDSLELGLMRPRDKCHWA